MHFRLKSLGGTRSEVVTCWGEFKEITYSFHIAAVAGCEPARDSNAAGHVHLQQGRQARLSRQGAYRPSWVLAGSLGDQQQKHQGASVVPFLGPARPCSDAEPEPLGGDREASRDAGECLDGQETAGSSSSLCSGVPGRIRAREDTKTLAEKGATAVSTAGKERDGL